MINQMEKSSKDLNQKPSTKTVLTFFIPSLIGVALFVLPIPQDGNLTILLSIFTGYLNKVLKPALPMAGMIISVISVVGVIIVKVFKPKSLIENPVMESAFNISWGWAALRIVGMVSAIMVIFKIGPEWLLSKDTGGLMVNSLTPTVIPILFTCGYLLPFLLEYGLMEFIGTLVEKPFRKLFLLPGRSAIDCLASWLGAASLAVLITDKQYQSGRYTSRESAVVMTCFSASSVAFALVVITQLGLESHFFPIYIAVCIAGLVCAFILPRIPPLSLRKDEYYNGIDNSLPEESGEGYTRLQWAYKQGLKKAEEGYSFKQVIEDGTKGAVGTMMGVIPAMIGIGTVSLVLAEYTPAFQWMGAPYIPLLKLLQVPEASAVASTFMGGFADNYIPAILGKAAVEGVLGKIIVAIVSFNGIIFMSGCGAVMVQSVTKITIWELLVIFVERTIVSIIVAAFLGRLIIGF